MSLYLLKSINLTSSPFDLENTGKIIAGVGDFVEVSSEAEVEALLDELEVVVVVVVFELERDDDLLAPTEIFFFCST